MISPRCLRRPTTSVLVAVALVSGAILLVGDRFGSARSSVLTQPVRADGKIAACVAEENMRLITVGRERCRSDEIELASGLATRSPGVSGVDAVAGFEIVTAGTAVAARQTATGEARCPAGKVAVGGGVMRNPDSPGRAGSEGHLELGASGPLLPGGRNGGHGWTATVRNTSSSPISIVVAATCVISR